MKNYLATTAICTVALVALWAGCTWMVFKRPPVETRPAPTATQPSIRPAVLIRFLVNGTPIPEGTPHPITARDVITIERAPTD